MGGVNVQQIRQAVTKESLFLELQRWCRDGAGKRNRTLQIMSAFASGPAVEALEPFFDVFLSDGNKIEIIVGIDRNGTTRDAIRQLYELQHAYTKRITCSIFNAPSRIAIFHPKLYLLHTPKTVSAMIGSANLTLGGLGNNFESIFLYREVNRQSIEAKHMLNTWSTFANPQPPLRGEFLRQLTAAYANELMLKLPKSSRMEKPESPNGVKDLWKPISKIQMPRSNAPVQNRIRVPQKQIGAFLVIDILTETRETQMQIPLAVVEGFFGLRRDEEGDISLSQIRAGHLTQPIERKVVKSGGTRRNMRRIEMPQIAGKARPLAAIFLRLKRRQFAVVVVPQNSPEFSAVNRLLRDSGQQPDHAVRRYYIGAAHDQRLPLLLTILGATALTTKLA
jgi:hypothetical protein